MNATTGGINKTLCMVVPRLNGEIRGRYLHIFYNYLPYYLRIIRHVIYDANLYIDNLNVFITNYSHSFFFCAASLLSGFSVNSSVVPVRKRILGRPSFTRKLLGGFVLRRRRFPFRRGPRRYPSPPLPSHPIKHLFSIGARLLTRALSRHIIILRSPFSSFLLEVRGLWVIVFSSYNLKEEGAHSEGLWPRDLFIHHRPDSLRPSNYFCFSCKYRRFRAAFLFSREFWQFLRKKKLPSSDLNEGGKAVLNWATRVL